MHREISALENADVAYKERSEKVHLMSFSPSGKAIGAVHVHRD